MQTAAAPVVGTASMSMLIHAMVWMGLPQPPMGQLMLFMLSIGMFGADVGMLYTPILVDRLLLTLPSGLAVANILRALTDPVLLVFVFALVNDTSLGISDSVPISSAFVTAMVLMAMLGLKKPVVGLMAGGILLVACSAAADMPPDCSIGWCLGIPRTIQFHFQLHFHFHFQVLGLVVRGVLTVGFARLFMSAYPVLALDQTVMQAKDLPGQWSSSMTHKIVGALRSVTDDKPHQRWAIVLGVGLGLAIQLVRQAVSGSGAYQRWRKRSAGTRAADFVFDAVLPPNPYAYSFGTFLGLAALGRGVARLLATVLT